MPFEVPESWEWTTINDISSKIGSGSTPRGSNYAKDGIPFFRSQNVYNNGLVYDDIKFISDEVHKSMIGTEVQAKDLLLNITGGSLGRCAVVPDDFHKGNVSQHVCILRTIVVLPAYLHLFIISDYFASTMILSGSGREGLPKYSLEIMQIPLPPLTEQHRIVAAVEKWFSLIDTLETAKEDLQTSIAQAKSKILDLAIHGKLVPQDPSDEPAIELLKRINPKFTPCDNAHCQYRFPIYWELVKLEDVCEFIRNGVSIRQIKGANGIPITRIETISNGIVDRDRMGYADIIDDTYEKYYLQHGDILMSHINSPIHVGKSALYESIEGEKIIHGMNLLCLRMKTGICPKYMNYLFMSEIFKYEIRPYIKNAVNQASINTRNLGGVYSPIPPYKEQQRIVAKIEELFAVLDEIQKSIEA